MNSSSIISLRYFNLIRYLKPEIQLEIIELISKSLITVVAQEKKSVAHLFGAWHDETSADDLIAQLRNSRTTNRTIEEL